MVCYFSTRNCGTLSWTYVTVSGADAYSGTSTRISVSRIVLYRREHNKSLPPRRNGEEQRFFLSLRRSKRHVDILWFNERTKIEMCLRMKLYERYIIYVQSSKYCIRWLRACRTVSERQQESVCFWQISGDVVFLRATLTSVYLPSVLIAEERACLPKYR